MRTVIKTTTQNFQVGCWIPTEDGEDGEMEYTAAKVQEFVKISPEMYDFILVNFESLKDAFAEDLRDIWQRLNAAGIR